MQNALMQPRIDGTMQATPRNALLGYIADALNSANAYANKPNPSMPMGKANPPLSLLANALGIGDLGATADRMSYGHPLTQGQGMARRMLPETANALLTVAPVAAKFPKQAAAVGAGLMSGDVNAARAAMVWHGSPHKFDKFDSSKIGTGEGAQAYGHGLYLAESPDVARGYSLMGDQNTTAQQYLRLWGGDREKAEAAFLKDVKEGAFGNRTSQIAQDGDILASIRGKGQMYKVDLPDSAISRMLDWDKPLSRQNVPMDLFGVAQRERLRNMPSANGTPSIPPKVAQDIAASKNGATAYQMLVDAYGKEGAALALRRSGVPGIRYLDGGSRGAGSGTSNFVVFPGEESILQILERNGVPIK